MGAGGAGAKYDDNFYDLDDDFIDDGELENMDQDEDMELFADGDTSKFQSGRESVIPSASKVGGGYEDGDGNAAANNSDREEGENNNGENE